MGRERENAQGGERKIKEPVVGSRVKMGVGGHRMSREAIEKIANEGDKILRIDPDSEMRRNEEKELRRTVIQSTITRIALNGIRTEETAHDYLRDDGVWSYTDDEEGR